LAAGRDKGGVYYGISKLMEKGVVKKIGVGMYSRSDVKQITGPPAEKREVKKDGVSNADFAIRIASRAHGKFSSASLKAPFEKDGRSRTSVGPVIASLLKSSRAERVSEGHYVLLKDKPASKKSARKKPAAKKAEAVKPNGGDIAEVTHG
jgi:hypothetical protein